MFEPIHIFMVLSFVVIAPAFQNIQKNLILQFRYFISRIAKHCKNSSLISNSKLCVPPILLILFISVYTNLISFYILVRPISRIFLYSSSTNIPYLSISQFDQYPVSFYILVPPISRIFLYPSSTNILYLSISWFD